uniref:FAR1 domain-containing protein n=1 Tax=Chenopodium quinoa TaxID=63459 RepID=A0A803LFU4_CHEQI
MIFDTWEETDVYYNAFGKQEGFVDNRRRIGGKRVVKELEGELIATNKSKKCGYEARMYEGLKEHSKWEITRVELEHKPHMVSPSKSMLVTKYRLEELERMPYVRRKLHFGDNVGLPSAKMHKWFASERNGVDNMPFTKKDVNNLISREKRLKLKDKQYYLDVPSYLTRTLKPLSMWLFSTWLDAVGGKPPVAILIDQDPPVERYQCGDIVVASIKDPPIKRGPGCVRSTRFMTTFEEVTR